MTQPGTARTVLLTIAATLLVLAAGAAALLYSGAYDVAATRDHTALGRWLLHTGRDRSVAVRADEVPDPPAMDSTALAHGFEHYHAMCEECHGAPGVERGELGKGITPTPPDLAEEAAELTAKELFWITKHGLKLAGMPAFGPTHSDQELWGIVAFVERLPDMGPEEYRAWTERLAASRGESDAAETDHEHAPGTPAHTH